MAIQENSSQTGTVRGAMVSGAGFFVGVGVLLFLPAGIHWVTGWVFIGIFLIWVVISGAYLWRANPEIFPARSRVHSGTKAWDKVVLAVIRLAFAALFLVAGFDARNGWSAAPDWVVATGHLLFAFGFALCTWVLAVNKFAEPSVRIQSERGQRVIDRGPYAIVRHPLYFASAFLMAGMALALGSYWALVAVLVAEALIALRTVFEDRMLQAELPGYREYAGRVRYKVIPGVW